MNILLVKHFFIVFMVSEIPRVSVFGNCPYSVTFPYWCSEKEVMFFYYDIQHYK